MNLNAWESETEELKFMRASSGFSGTVVTFGERVCKARAVLSMGPSTPDPPEILESC